MKKIQKKENNKSKASKKKGKSASSGGVGAFVFLVIVALSVAFLFVACKANDESSKDSSDVINQSYFEEKSEFDSDTSDESQLSESENSGSGDLSEETPSADDSSEETSQNEENKGGEKYAHISWFIAENGKRYDEFGEKNPNYTLEQVVTYVNIGLDGPYYTNTYPAKKDDGIFILVNKYSYVDKNFTPDNLVELDPSCKVSGKSVKLVKEAADAFKKLSDDASALEYNIIGMSGYRTYSYQENLYNKYLKTDTQENVDTYSARPGYSEHHTGLALDVQTDKVSFSNFGKTKEYEWLLDNAHKYGFVIHYTTENQWITGYMPEEWHIRYLGVEAATWIYDHNLSVDEYLVMYGAKGPGAAG